MDVEEIDPISLLSTELYTDTVDPLLTHPDNEDDNDVEEIIQEPEIIDIIDDEPDTPPVTSNGLSHAQEAIVWQPGQLPADYTVAEREYFDKHFGPGQQTIQFYRLHCTACNAHLGSAPSDQSKRYIHPLLKVLICKSCFDFYGSGDFDKDEDGSELYCRWCGQGGKVLCCAKCPFVFCQRCIRVNMGKKCLDMVKVSDDWLCFVCNPAQIVKLRVMCRALYEYVQKEIKWSEENQQQTQFLSLDKSLCCKTKPGSTKRKEDDTMFHGNLENRKKKRLQINPLATIANESLTNSLNSWGEAGHEDEVVCTPDITMLMDGVDEPAQPVPHIISQNDPLLEDETETPPSPIVTKKADRVKVVTFAKTKPNKKSTNKLGSTVPNKVTKTVLGKKKGSNISKKKIIFDKHQHTWFEKATEMTAKVNQSLTTKVCSLSNAPSEVDTPESLAQLHNSLQDVLSNAINSLMEVRKTLRANFIASIKNLHFAEESTEDKSPSPASQNNDVILVESTPAPVEEPVELPPKLSRAYLKVKPPSELLASSIITIPDDVAPPEISSPPKGRTPSPESRQDNHQIENSQTEDLSEIVDSLNPETVTEIKRALLESKFEKIVNENLSLNVSLPPEELKKMASVRVILSPNYKRSKNPQPSPTASVNEVRNETVNNDYEEDIENILSVSTLVNPAKKVSDDSSVIYDEQSDPLALDDDSVNNDLSIGSFNEDANVNGGLTNNSEGITVV